MKKFWLVLLMLLVPVLVNATSTQLTDVIYMADGHMMISDGTDATWFAAATDTVLSPAIYVGDTDGYLGLWIKNLSTAGTPNIKVEVMESYDDTDANFVVPINAADIPIVAASEDPQVVTLFVVAMDYIKIRWTGIAGNETDTTSKNVVRIRRAHKDR